MANVFPEYETNPSDPSSKNQQKHRISVLWKRIGLCVCVALTVYGAVRLIGYFNDLHRSRQTTQELREALAEAQTAELIPEEPDDMRSFHIASGTGFCSLTRCMKKESLRSSPWRRSA